MRVFISILIKVIELQVDHLEYSHTESEQIRSHCNAILDILSVDPEVRELIS